jgi:hypothetical protein
MSTQKTIVQVAQERGVHRRTVINWIHKGYVQAVKKGFGRTSPWVITHVRNSQVSPPPPGQRSIFPFPGEVQRPPRSAGSDAIIDPESGEIVTFESTRRQPPTLAEPRYAPFPGGLYPGDDVGYDDVDQS